MKAERNRILPQINSTLRSHKKELKKYFGVKKIGIFGSYARNENTKRSDIDILVEFDKPVGFFQFLRLERHLSQIIGVKVDLVTKNALKPYIGRRILEEVVYV